jgi:hypothetical protein
MAAVVAAAMVAQTMMVALVVPAMTIPATLVHIAVMLAAQAAGAVQRVMVPAMTMAVLGVLMAAGAARMEVMAILVLEPMELSS